MENIALEIMKKREQEIIEKMKNEQIDNYIFTQFSDKYIIFYIQKSNKELRCYYINKNNLEKEAENVPVKKEYRKKEDFKDMPNDNSFFFYCFKMENDLTEPICVIFMYKDVLNRRFGGIRTVYETNYYSLDKAIDDLDFKSWIKRIKNEQ